MDYLLGATQTGGSSVTLIPAGTSPGKASFRTPDHTLLTPEMVEFTVQGGTPLNAKDPGVARTGLKISFASRQVGEGCCDAKAGAVIVDLGVRWNLNQPETVVDDIVAHLRGIVYSAEFEDAITKGILPS